MKSSKLIASIFSGSIKQMFKDKSLPKGTDKSATIVCDRS